jgi:hypothetical protein
MIIYSYMSKKVLFFYNCSLAVGSNYIFLAIHERIHITSSGHGQEPAEHPGFPGLDVLHYEGAQFYHFLPKYVGHVLMGDDRPRGMGRMGHGVIVVLTMRGVQNVNKKYNYCNAYD